MSMKNVAPHNGTQSQEAAILKHLQAGYKITPLDALEYFQCMRLSGRIHGLRKAGHQIQSESITTSTGKRIAEYSLIKTQTK